MNTPPTLENVRVCPCCGEFVRIDQGLMPPMLTFDERVHVLVSNPEKVLADLMASLKRQTDSARLAFEAARKEGLL